MKYLSVIVMVLSFAACDDCVECGDEETFAPDGAPSEGCDPQECKTYCSDMSYSEAYCISRYSNSESKIIESCQCLQPTKSNDLNCIEYDKICDDNIVYTCIDNTWQKEVDCNIVYENGTCTQFTSSGGLGIGRLTNTGQTPFKTEANCSGNNPIADAIWCGASEIEECEIEYDNCDSEIGDCEGSRCQCLEFADCMKHFNELNCIPSVEPKICTNDNIKDCDTNYDLCINGPGSRDCDEERCICLEYNNCMEQFNELDCSTS